MRNAIEWNHLKKYNVLLLESARFSPVFTLPAPSPTPKGLSSVLCVGMTQVSDLWSSPKLRCLRILVARVALQ